MDVIGLGTVAMDVLMKVDKLPQKDGFCIVESTTYQPGGSGTNVIVQLARLGVQCSYIAAVADDTYGRDLQESLRDEGVDTSCMTVAEKGITLHTDIVVERTGDKFIMLNMGDVFGGLELNSRQEEAVKAASVFYTDLCPGNPAKQALSLAKKSGAKTVFNLQVGLDTMEGLGVTKDDILHCIRDVDVFAPCREGLFNLAGTADPDECSRFLRPYTDALLLFTLGADGSAAYGADGRKWETPAAAATVVDTTGAGDSYMGGFIYAYYFKNLGVLESMRFASVCAAHTCGGLGARVSPKLKMVESYLEGTPKKDG